MKIKTAHIALILSILALAVSLFTAVQVGQNDNDALIRALMAQNEQLQAQIDALTGGQSVGNTESQAVPGATLTAVSWADGSGADVVLTLEDTSVSATLRVMLGSQVITEAPCVPDGGHLTATAAVPANNGYTYSLIIGNEAKTLASPENPVYPELVFLADSLSAYCNLVVGDWYVRDRVLTLENGYATIHTPHYGDDDIGYTDVRLVLKHGDQVLAENAISPAETEEGSRSFACAIENAAFPLPELADGEQVDLYLEATLTNGQILTHCAATWYAMGTGFSMAAG